MKFLIRIFYLFLFVFFVNLLFPFSIKGELLKFTGNSLPVIEIKPDKNTGLDMIYVIDNIDNVSIEFTSESETEWYYYSNLGAAYSEPITNIEKDNDIYILKSPAPNRGLVITNAVKTYYFWVVNYKDYVFNVTDIYPATEQECEATILDVKGDAKPINYYTINGRQEILNRDINIEYYSLEWDEESNNFLQTEFVKSLTSIDNHIIITPPVYCSTFFTIKGDRFLEYWNLGQAIISDMFTPYGVEVVTEAVQETETGEMSNKINNDTEGLGGSAPCEINFVSYVSDGVIHYEWQMSNDEEFEDITYRINEQDFTYNFTQEGTTYIRFIGSNSDGSCEAVGDTYTVNIGNSELLIPNAFSPNGDGVNDIWKISYRSLIEFKCWIFDRYGHQIYYFEDPAGGWDGKRGGKTVKSGVYYYVIQAVGSDGKKYKKSGDINILKSNGSLSSSESDYEE